MSQQSATSRTSKRGWIILDAHYVYITAVVGACFALLPSLSPTFLTRHHHHSQDLDFHHISITSSSKWNQIPFASLNGMRDVRSSGPLKRMTMHGIYYNLFFREICSKKKLILGEEERFVRGTLISTLNWDRTRSFIFVRCEQNWNFIQFSCSFSRLSVWEIFRLRWPAMTKVRDESS